MEESFRVKSTDSSLLSDQTEQLLLFAEAEVEASIERLYATVLLNINLSSKLRVELQSLRASVELRLLVER